MFRKVTLGLLVLLLIILVVIYYPEYVETPVKDGQGPLAVYVSAQYAVPDSHNPLTYWKIHHQDVLNRGDLVQADCLYCHVPEQSCNNCHAYVGAKAIIP
jgi:hypothetical protein